MNLSHPILPRSLRELCRDLEKPKHRLLHREFLLEGARIVEEAVAAGAPLLFAVATHAWLEKSPTLAPALARKKIPLYRAPEKDFRLFSRTVQSQGILAVARLPEKEETDYDALFRGDLVPLFDAISDPGNLGTAIRACDWFGIRSILLSEGSVDPYNPKTVRSTMGSIFRVRCVPFADFDQVAGAARDRGYAICAAEADAPPARSEDWHRGKVLLLFGNEAHGIDPGYRDRIDRSISIPRYGEAESLNVSMACAILLAQYRAAVGMPFAVQGKEPA